jgi:MFS transporter, FSR family, fosmidomycin resistance protein
LLGLAPNYLVLVALLLVAGTGTSIFHPVSAAMAGAAAPARARGRWLGLYVTAGNFGLALGPLAFGILIAAYGLRGTWPIMLPALVVATLVALTAPRRSAPARKMPSLRETLRRHGRLLSSLVVVVGLRAWTAAATVTFIPLLAGQRGLSIDQGAQVLTVYLIAGACGGLVGGFAADRWGRDRVIVTSLLLSVPCGLFMALTSDTGIWFVLSAAASGFLLNGSFVVLTIRGQESLPGSVGMVSGIMLGLSVGIGGVLFTPLAIIGQWFGIPVAAALAALLGGVAAFAMRFVPRPASVVSP